MGKREYSRLDWTDVHTKILRENLIAARERAGYKLGKDAAGAIGIQATQLSGYESGRTGIDLPRLLVVAAVYQVPLDDLVTGLNPRYDAVIRQRLPLNVRRVMEAQILAVMRSGVEMAESARGDQASTPEPSASIPPAGPESSSGRRRVIRVRGRKGKKR